MIPVKDDKLCESALKESKTGKWRARLLGKVIS